MVVFSEVAFAVDAVSASMNSRPSTIRDFETFCADQGIRILERVVIDRGRVVSALPNLLGSLAVYRFDRGSQP